MPARGLCLSEGGPSSLCLNSCLCGNHHLCGQSHRKPWSPMRSKPRGPKPPVLLPRPPGGDNRTSKPPQGTGPDTAASGPNGGGSRSGVVTREPGGRPSAWSLKASPWLTWSAPSSVPFLHVHDGCPEGQLPPPKFWRNKVKMQLLEDECPFTADKGYSVWDPRGPWDKTQY